jgi:hypothetical protein
LIAFDILLKSNSQKFSHKICFTEDQGLKFVLFLNLSPSSSAMVNINWLSHVEAKTLEFFTTQVGLWVADKLFWTTFCQKLRKNGQNTDNFESTLHRGWTPLKIYE